MSLPKPPDEWLEERGYIDRWHGWWTLSPARRVDVAAIYEYEQRHGKPPPDNFTEGTRAYDQWTYKGSGDPREAAA